MRSYSLSGVLLAAWAASMLAACTIDKQGAPGLMGPSTLGVSVTVSATPDTVDRDGVSQSRIRVQVNGPQGEPLPDRWVALETTGGTLSADEVLTGSDGSVTVTFTAPDAQSGVSSVLVRATAVGTNANNSFTHQVALTLRGPTLPTPSFVFSPEEPARLDLVTFSASGTTLGGVICGTGCTYSWNFGDGSSATGRTANHRFESQGSFLVTLTVTAPGNVSAETSQTVVVGAAAEITADIAFSPTNPRGGETVFFSAAGSTTPDGVAIEEYSWNFGDGDTASGLTASNVYPTLATARTYTVTLTITDALGRTASTSETVTVAAP